jgi:hypothetical protein
MLRDNLVGLIEPMFSSAGPYPLALCTEWKQSSDDRPPCLENPRPEGAESTLTENAPSPFHAEPRQSPEVHSARGYAPALLNIGSMSPPSYPSAWLHPYNARLSFTWQVDFSREGDIDWSASNRRVIRDLAASAIARSPPEPPARIFLRHDKVN